MSPGEGRIGGAARAGILLFGLAAAAPLAACSPFATAFQEKAYFEPSSNDFGGVGLLQTRTARFHEDGHLEVGASVIEPYRRYFVTFQPLPWVEATFRYTDIRNRLFSDIPEFSGDQSFKDRGADLKLKLWNEGDWLPQVALGLQDGLGTGLFSSEYIVASKRWYDFDFHLGAAWGYLGHGGDFENPFINLGDEFRTRRSDSAQGGALNFSSYFSGETFGLFGGVEWNTPIEGLSLKLEYDGNDYQDDPLGNRFEVDSPVNIGLNYRPFEWLDVSAAFERGNSAMFRVSLRSNLKAGGIPKTDPPPPEVPVRPRGPDAASGEPAGVPAAAAPAASGQEAVPRAAASDARETAVLARAAEAELAASLRAEGVPLTRVRLAEDALVAMLAEGAETPERSRLLRAAARSLDGLPEAATRVVFKPAAQRGAAMLDIAFSRKELLHAAAVQRMREVMGRLGYEVVGYRLVGSAFDVVIANNVPSDPAQDRYAAEEVLAAAPRQIGRVAIVRRLVDTDVTRAEAVRAEPEVAPLQPALAQEGVPAAPLPEAERRAIAQKLVEALEAEAFTVEGVHLAPPTAAVYVTPLRFRQTARNIGRAARVVAGQVPASVEEIQIVLVNSGLEIARVAIMRSDLEDAIAKGGSPEEIWGNARIEAPEPHFLGGLLPEDGDYNPDRYPDFDWGVRPAIRQYIGGPEAFHLYQLWAAISADLEVARGLSVSGLIGKDIINNFDELNTPSDSVLPHVRSDIQQYLKEGADGNLVRLQADYVFSPAENWFGRVSAGIFEEMFGGVGGEVLYRPYGARWAASVDINRVRRRTFDQRFEFQDYEVTTGHLNLYYKVPFYDLLAEVHAGRFLAGDHGAQFVLSRRFDSGVRIGAWATFTDVPFEKFGEGSFDKGFYVTVPLELFLTNSTRRAATFAFRPLTRDGGQMLVIANRLYSIVESGNLDGLVDDWDQFLD